MFIELPDGDKTVYTHSSLVDESKQEQINKIYAQAPSWTNGARFLSLWGSIEAVNRVSLLSKLPLYQRGLVVAASTLVGGLVGDVVYWNATGSKSQVRKLLNGAPVYEKKIDVPELDKVFFFLDDDNNYKPSLNHHAV